MATAISIDGTSLGPNFPKIGRVFDIERPTPQGPGMRKVTITLVGFVDGCTPDEIVTKYNALEAALKKNQVSLTMTIGSQTYCSNKTAYVQSYNEPEEWKATDGEYTIQLYYWETLDDSDTIFGDCLFGGYALSPLPSFGRKTANSKKSYGDSVNLDSGGNAKHKINITLQGFIPVTDVDDALTKQAAMTEAFMANGAINTLSYGGFSQTCHCTSLSFNDDVAANQLFYQAEFEYYSSTVFEIISNVSFTRSYTNFTVKPKAGCNESTIVIGNTSGQEVTYNVSVTAVDIATAKSECATQIAAIVDPDGYEMEGGTESKDLATNTYSVTLKKYFQIPIHANTGT